MVAALQTLCRPTLSIPLAGSFINWYLRERPLHVLKTYIAYARMLGDIFSPTFLLRTLFKPWKNITDAYPTKGFNLNLIAQAFTLNVVSRIIGALFRVTALVTGIVFQIILLVAFAAYLGLWFAFPVMFVMGLGFLSSVFFK